MPKQFTLGEIAEYCFHNKGSDCFQGNTLIEIIRSVKICYEAGTIIVVTNKGGTQLLGVAMGEIMPHDPITGRRVMHVDNIITTHPQGFQTLFIQFLIRFPDCDLQGYRKGKLKVYDRERLRHSLSIMPTHQHCLAA